MRRSLLRPWKFQRFIQSNLSYRCISQETREKLIQCIRDKQPSDLLKVLRGAAEQLSLSHEKLSTIGVLAPSSPLQIAKYFQVLFQNEYHRDSIDLAKSSMCCLDQVIPYTSYNATVHLINYFCEKDDVRTAWSYYTHLRDIVTALDSITFENFAGKLCDNAMIDELEELLSVQKPTVLVIERMIEPYILSGRIYDFSLHFTEILKSGEIMSHLHGFSYIVELLLKARLRRAISGAPRTLSEMLGIQLIHKELNIAQECLEEMDNLETKRSGLGRCVATIFHYLGYCEDSWDGETVPAPLQLSSEERATLDTILAREPSSTFKYMIEHRHFYDNDGFLAQSPFAVTDVTAELADDKLKTPLLYHADLFFNSKEDERRFVSMISNDALDLQTISIFDETLEQLDALEDMENDEDDEDDYDENDDEFDDSYEETEEDFQVDQFYEKAAMHRHKDGDENLIPGFEVEIDDEDLEMSEKLASSKPRQRIHDLSRSLYSSFGRYKPTFDDDFFDEMEIISYEDPDAIKHYTSHPFGSNPDIFPDDQGGTFMHHSSKPLDAGVEK